MRPKDPNTFGKMVLRVFPMAFTRRLGPLARQVAHYSGIAPKDDVDVGEEDEDEEDDTVPAISGLSLPTQKHNPPPINQAIRQTVPRSSQIPRAMLPFPLAQTPPSKPPSSLPTQPTSFSLPPVKIEGFTSRTPSFTPLDQQQLFAAYGRPQPHCSPRPIPTTTTTTTTPIQIPSHLPQVEATVCPMDSDPFLMLPSGTPPEVRQAQDMEFDFLVQQLINEGPDTPVNWA